MFEKPLWYMTKLNLHDCILNGAADKEIILLEISFVNAFGAQTAESPEE